MLRTPVAAIMLHAAVYEPMRGTDASLSDSAMQRPCLVTYSLSPDRPDLGLFCSMLSKAVGFGLSCNVSQSMSDSLTLNLVLKIGSLLATRECPFHWPESRNDEMEPNGNDIGMGQVSMPLDPKMVMMSCIFQC